MSEASTSGASALSDPLIGAMVGKLPMPSSPYPRAQRVNWLRMMVMAFNEAYGVTDPITVGGGDELTVSGSARLTLLKPDDVSAALRPAVAAPTDRYRIDGQGFALRGETPIDPHDVPHGAVIDDERGGLECGDLGTILWKSSGAIAPEKLPNLQLRAA